VAITNSECSPEWQAPHMLLNYFKKALCSCLQDSPYQRFSARSDIVPQWHLAMAGDIFGLQNKRCSCICG
jgi:hypothetical protein